MNPAERVMRLLDLGLQNCATERYSAAEPMEKILKSCNSMADIRKKAEKHDVLRDAWDASLHSVKNIIGDRFSKLVLKTQPVSNVTPVTDGDIDIIQRHMRELFPDLDPKKLQKMHTKKSKAYNDFVATHCRLRHYTFQVRRCSDGNCCLQTDKSFSWLPDPVLQNDEHYLDFHSVRGETEEILPSWEKKRRDQNLEEEVIAEVLGEHGPDQAGRNPEEVMVA